MLRACHCTSSWSLCRLPFFGIWRFVQPVWPMLPASCVLNDASCTSCGGLMQETSCCISILCCALSDTLSIASSPPAPRLRNRTASSDHLHPSQQRSRSRSRSHRAHLALRTISAHSPPAPLLRACAGPPPGVFFNARRSHRTTRCGSTTLNVFVHWVRRLTPRTLLKKMSFMLTVSQTPRPSELCLLTRGRPRVSEHFQSLEFEGPVLKPGDLAIWVRRIRARLNTLHTPRAYVRSVSQMTM